MPAPATELADPPGTGERVDGTSPGATSAVVRRLVVGALVLTLLVVVVASDTLYAALGAAITAVEPLLGARPLLGAVLFVALAAISAVLAFFSSSALVPVALGVWGPFGTAALLWIGWTAGGVASYTVGRVLGRAVGGGRSGFARALERLRPDTPLVVVALLQVALQSEVSGLVLGAARYPVLRYLVSLAVVEALFTVLTVAAGMGLVERQPGLLVVATVAFVALAAGALVVVHRRLPGAPPT